MDNLKWWITLTPSQKVSALMALIVVGQFYFNKQSREDDKLTIEQLTKKVNTLTISKDSALNVARIVEIQALKREVSLKEESLEEQKKKNEKNEAINEAQKQQLANNEAYANQLINILNKQKK